MKQKFVILTCLTVLTLGLAACNNTMDGAGRDIENWGKDIQRNS